MSSIHFLFTRTNDMYFTKIAANYNTTTVKHGLRLKRYTNIINGYNAAKYTNIKRSNILHL